MKNVIVSATALASSGGLSILKQFLRFASTQTDVKFIAYVPDWIELESYNNIVYIKSGKKNWLQRILWDSRDLQREIKRLGLKVDCVISLQNTSVNVPFNQLVYIQQSIPFSDLKTPFTKSGIKIWFYKKFYSFFIFLFSNKNARFFVQTEWMRDAIIRKGTIAPEIISVVKPELNIDGLCELDIQKDKTVIDILYPATPFFYKQHNLFIDILKGAKDKYDLKNIRVHFTFTPDMNPQFVEEIKANGLFEQFIFHGVLSQPKLYELYNYVDLIVFPSLLETVGLPLLEAAYLGKPVLVSDLPYAHEVLKNYEGAFFLNSNDGVEWAEMLSKYHSGTIPEKYKSLNFDTSDGWMVFRDFF